MEKPAFEKSKYLEVPPEYTPSEKHIEYHELFSSGEQFNAQEQSDGTVKITIEKNGETLFDFSHILPEGYAFVSYPWVAHLEKKENKDIPWVGWMAVPRYKHIQIGEFESAADILALLHEIGHVTRYETEGKTHEKEGAEHKRQLLQQEGFEYAGDPDLFVLSQEDIAKVVSKTERDAWAFALQTLRKLEKELALDTNNIYTNSRELKNIVNRELETYKINYDWLVEKDPGFSEEFKNLFNKNE